MNIPNIITILRLICVPFIIYLLYIPMPWGKWASLILFIIAISSDVVDGMIARKKNLITTFGIFLDPVVDKILVLSLFFALSDLSIIPIWVPLIILWRELLVTGVRSVASSHGQIIGANWMGKTKIVFQTSTIIIGQLLLAIQSENWFLDAQMDIGNIVVKMLFISTAALSVVFAGIFTYWNRSLLFKDV